MQQCDRNKRQNNPGFLRGTATYTYTEPSHYYCHTLSTLCTIQVRALEKFRVVCVACGSRDAQTLAATENGALWAWGDGSFGKLGKGDTAGSHTPLKVKVFNTEEIAQLECGAQFSMMLTKDGKVYTW